MAILLVCWHNAGWDKGWWGPLLALAKPPPGTAYRTFGVLYVLYSEIAIATSPTHMSTPPGRRQQLHFLPV